MLTGAERRLLTEALWMADRAEWLSSLGVRPYDWQRAVLGSKCPWKILACARQAGKSAVVSAMACHCAKYRPGATVLVMTPTQRQSQLDMRKIRGYARLDPNYPALRKDNDGEMELENGSVVYVVTATEGAARGYSDPDLVILDEASRIPDEAYQAVLGTLNTDSRERVKERELVMLSTFFGRRGFFWNTWERKGNGYEKYLVRSPWEPDADGLGLLPAPMKPDELAAWGRAQGYALACYSPRHMDEGLQKAILLGMDTGGGDDDEVLPGRDSYLQEMCCMAVDTYGMVYSYGDIERAFALGEMALEEAGDGMPGAIAEAADAEEDSALMPFDRRIGEYAYGQG